MLPPRSSNFGLFNDPAVNKLIDQARAAQRPASDDLWTKTDHAVMSDAAFYPFADPHEPTYHAAQVRGFVYLPAYQTGDFTNVWLDPANNGA
jgi:peptide/nickel transport system substrate-binding protein